MYSNGLRVSDSISSITYISVWLNGVINEMEFQKLSRKPLLVSKTSVKYELTVFMTSYKLTLVKCLGLNSLIKNPY